MLLKKLRFREILKEHMKPPEEILENTDEDVNSKARHKGNKGLCHPSIATKHSGFFFH